MCSNKYYYFLKKKKSNKKYKNSSNIAIQQLKNINNVNIKHKIINPIVQYKKKS